MHEQAMIQMTKLGDIVQNQTAAITDLNYRVEKMNREIEDLKTPNFDTVFAYVDRQVCPKKHV
jgi:hypothetical protein